MKDISTILLASVFVLFSLIILISAASNPDRTSSTLDNDQQRVSDLGLRFAFKRQGYTEVLHNLILLIPSPGIDPSLTNDRCGVGSATSDTSPVPLKSSA